MLPWIRAISVHDWITDQASHSYVISLPPASRVQLLGELQKIVSAAFPGGTASVHYETWLWIATKHLS